MCRAAEAVRVVASQLGITRLMQVAMEGVERVERVLAFFVFATPANLRMQSTNGSAPSLMA